MRWRLILEEYTPNLQYVPGNRNIVADALSRLDKTNKELQMHEIPEAFGMEDNEIPQYANYSRIERHQKQDTALQQKALEHDSYSLKSFCGGKRKSHELIVKNDKIVIPEGLQEQVVQWHHTQLCHPGEVRTEASIRQHFYWKNM